MLKNYIKTAVNHMRRNKTYTAINIFGLSIGLACVMLIVLYIKDDLSFDRFQTNGAQIYRLVQDGHGPDGTEYKSGFTGGVQGETFKQEIPEIQEFCRINGGGEELVKKGGNIISEKMLYADKSFFKIFSFPLIKGNPKTALDQISNVVITTAIAKKYFGDQNPIGKTLQINQNGNFVPFIVSGVANETPYNSTVRFDFLLNIERTLPSKYTSLDWFNSFLNSFIYLKKGANPQVAEQKMAQVFNQYAGKLIAEMKKTYGEKAGSSYKLQPYYNIHLDKDYGTGNGITASSKIDFSYILGGIALFILFIACINFINLSLSSSLRRSKEIGIRKVNGSTRWQLILQFIGESFLLTLIASFIAITLVAICLPKFNQLADKNLQLSYLVNGQTLAVFILLILVNTLLAGFYPAVVLSGFNPVQTLYGKLKISSNNYLAKSLVVVQFVVAVFLAIGTIVMQKQFNLLINADLGYKPQNIVDVRFPQEKHPNFELFKSQLSKYSSIKEVSGQVTPFTGMTGMEFDVDGKKLNTPFFEIDDQFLKELNIPIKQGRGFTTVAGDTTHCLINQFFAKAAGWKDSPIGHLIGENKHMYTVIGVTADFHNASLNSKIEPLLLKQPAAATYGQVLIKIDENQKVAALKAINTEFKKLVLDYPCTYNFLTDMLAGQYDQESRWKQIITIASVMSILISCLGLFGLATLAIEQRVKEIGIRKVLGATLTDITGILTVNFLTLVLIAVVIASPLAWYAMNKWLQNFPYRINLSLWVLILTGVGSLLIAFITISFQAVKAALANPVKSLRSE
ncbi:ABC transporter permease [uncultured Mucilaginibacter sp.]|uniref:ABC transporter permease n=1 Tax=uncultured Mucilaginibacter sp. TaxID=797541 RepID=UPI00262C1D3D|nr:ABC transporter permease [uncultured Mucilaginibacter sp.]